MNPRWETAGAMAAVHDYERALFVGSGALDQATYPALATVDETLASARTLDLASGVTLEVPALENAGVSSTQTVAYERPLEAGRPTARVYMTDHSIYVLAVAEGR
jgi:hypothetical protein